MKYEDQEQKPTKHTLENRAAGMDLVRDAALKGDPVCGGYFALEHIVNSTFPFVTTMVDQDEEDWDDERPF